MTRQLCIGAYRGWLLVCLGSFLGCGDPVLVGSVPGRSGGSAGAAGTPASSSRTGDTTGAPAGGRNSGADESESTGGGSAQSSGRGGASNAATRGATEAGGTKAGLGGSSSGSSSGSTTCSSDYTLCATDAGARCTDVDNDQRNCGACGVACDVGSDCASGECTVAACSADFTLGGIRAFARTGSGPIAVVAGDWNGDGKPDLATANQIGDSISVLLGGGDGTFAARVDYPAGDGPRAISSCDLNDDGKPDLANLNFTTSTLSILLGDVGGTFLPRTDYETGRYPRDLAVADLSGDGEQDVAVADADYVSVFLGNGDGTLRTRVVYPLPSYASLIEAADMNGDGKLDLVATGGSPPVSVLLGNGDGTFASALSQAFREHPYSTVDAMALGDFTGDGRLDLGIADNGGRGWTGNLYLLPGMGDGTFSSTPKFYNPPHQASRLVAGDVDLDGDLDWVTSVGTLLGPFDEQLAQPFDSGVRGGAWVLSDVDCDGRPDALIADSSWVSAELGNGDGTFANAIGTSFPDDDFAVLEDLNRDGERDLVSVTGQDNLVHVALGVGSGVFASMVEYPAETGARSLDVGDVNGDGNLDIIAGSTESSTTVLLGGGDGTFARMTNEPPTTGENVRLGDLNGDDVLDLVAVNYETQTIGVLLGASGGSFGMPTNYAEGDAMSWEPCVQIHDFDNDGHLDIATLMRNGISVLLGKGDGTFDSAKMAALHDDLTSCAVEDLNHDGKLDMVASSESPRLSVTVFFGNGDGTFVPNSEYVIDAGRNGDVRLGDLDGDGRTDIVVRSYYGLIALRGAGDGTFGCAVGYALGSASALALADLDHDGRIDVLHGTKVYLNKPLPAGSCR